MAKPYIYERQTEYWTSRGIEDYFLDAGYEIVTFPLSQKSEHEIPFDFVFLEKKTCKLFGFQYKALYTNECDYWPLNEEQHCKLQSYFDWGYYCLSQMTSSLDHRIAVHKAIFVPVTLDYKPKIIPGQISPYYRWGGFIKGLEQCPIGRRVTSREDIEKALKPIDRNYIEEVDREIVDVFVANVEKRRILHLDNR